MLSTWSSSVIAHTTEIRSTHLSAGMTLSTVSISHDATVGIHLVGIHRYASSEIRLCHQQRSLCPPFLNPQQPPLTVRLEVSASLVCFQPHALASLEPGATAVRIPIACCYHRPAKMKLNPWAKSGLSNARACISSVQLRVSMQGTSVHQTLHAGINQASLSASSAFFRHVLP